MLTRRELLKRATRAGIAAALMPAACTVPAPEPDGVWVNDVHSQLNRTRVLAARGRSTFSELRWYPPMEAAKGSLSWVFRAKQPESVRTGP